MNPGDDSSDRVTAAEVADSPHFRRGVERLAEELGRDPAGVEAQARACLAEMQSGHTRLFHGLVVRAGRALCRLGYSRIDYDPAQVERVGPLFVRHPAVVLSSHRSYLDGAALTVGFHDHRLPRLFEFVGINMAFWPLGPMWRRMGGILLRRRLDDPVYKFALRQYLGRLLERRRHLRWFIEGTRSRTGKLAPPKLGLLAYVVEAWFEGRSDDLLLLPVSVSYDQLHEVEEFAAAARGERKQAESLGWLIRYLRALRGRFGAIYVRFGEPVSVCQALGPAPAVAAMERPERERALTRLALAVSWRINQATPITGVALAAIALLGGRGAALDARTLATSVTGYLEHARAAGMPLAPDADLTRPDMLAGTLELLEARGVVERSAGGWSIARDGHLKVAYYRNSLIHFFLPGAIAELALLDAVEAPPGERRQRFESAALELRDLLKFEFFFPEREEFRASLLAEASRLAPDWEVRLEGGLDGILGLLEQAPTLSSDMLLRSFIGAYAVVADTLCELPPAVAVEPESFLSACERRADAYLAARRLRNPESRSRILFGTGLKLAGHRGLTDSADGRTRFALELWAMLRRMDVVYQVAVRRVQQLSAKA